MHYCHHNQNVQLPTQERMIVAEVSSDFEQLLDGMPGLVGTDVVIYDAETHCWWDKAVKQPARLQAFWAIWTVKDQGYTTACGYCRSTKWNPAPLCPTCLKELGILE